jgi:hypothetical protein
MSAERYASIVDVHVILRRAGIDPSLPAEAVAAR